MKKPQLAAALLMIGGAASAAPTLLSGFEPGLVGWQTIGDVSAQTSAVGLHPTQGTASAFLTTMSGIENPFSGVGSPVAGDARQFLGLPRDAGFPGTSDFLNVMPPLNLAFPGGYYAPPEVGESGAMRLRFYVDAPSVVSFDWNRIGRDHDSAFFSVWADDASGYRLNDWLFAMPNFGLPFVASAVDLCPRTPQYCRPDYNVNGETGWQHKSLALSTPGWYYIGFAMGEVAEGTVPSVLALDNLQIQAQAELPEPSSLMLVTGALLAIAAARRAADRKR